MLKSAKGKSSTFSKAKKRSKEIGEGLEFGAMTENKIEIARDDEIVIIGK